MPADHDERLFDDELRTFLRGPVSAFLGTADALGTPDASRIAGMAAIDDRRLRVLIGTDADIARRNAAVGATVAVLVTDITDYRSVQWKGTVVAVDAARSLGDVALVDHHIEQFLEACPIVGIDPVLGWRIFPVDVVPLVVEMTSMFDQTPGPRAGQVVARS